MLLRGLGLLLLSLFALYAWRALSRARELFRLSARHGELSLERGRLPPALLQELADVARRERLHEVVIRAVVEGGKPRLIVDGDSKGAEQPLRNVLGRFTLLQIRAGRRRSR
ncbi:MAG TPA: DUF3634 family protein [Polyangiaceae bacterium]|nr:DUF3634 family protein [Polyangiaceae bacterium]